MKRFLLLILFSITSNVFAVGLPIDVERFIEQRDGCDHFRGEYPYDDERRKFMQRNLQELCTGTDKTLAQLRKKYKTRPDVIDKLNDYEPQIELSRKNP